MNRKEMMDRANALMKERDLLYIEFEEAKKEPDHMKALMQLDRIQRELLKILMEMKELADKAHQMRVSQMREVVGQVTDINEIRPD